MSGWTRSEKIAALSLIVGILSAIAAWLAVPAFRKESTKTEALQPTPQVALSPAQSSNPKSDPTRNEIPQAQQTPEQEKSESVRLKHDLLRFDGFYVISNHGQWLKFYDNGRVVSVTATAGNVREAKNKLDDTDSQWDTNYEVSGNQIWFTHEVVNDGKHFFNRYSGYIYSDKMTLTYTGPFLYGTSDWIFVPLP